MLHIYQLNYRILSERDRIVSKINECQVNIEYQYNLLSVLVNNQFNFYPMYMGNPYTGTLANSKSSSGNTGFALFANIKTTLTCLRE